MGLPLSLNSCFTSEMSSFSLSQAYIWHAEEKHTYTRQGIETQHTNYYKCMPSPVSISTTISSVYQVHSTISKLPILSKRKMKAGAVVATDKEASKPIPIPKVRVSRVLSVLDFTLRVVAALGTLASAIAMGTSRETLPFAMQFVRFRARFKDLPTLM